jgi:hypothetical protein
MPVLTRTDEVEEVGANQRRVTAQPSPARTAGREQEVRADQQHPGRNSSSTGSSLLTTASNPAASTTPSTASQRDSTPVRQEMVAVEIMKTPAIFTA